MFYRFLITTPANTPATEKQETELKLVHGIIHQVEVAFPPGPQALLHVHINRAIHQIWPTNTGSDFANDSTTIRFKEHYPLQ